jgi:hypothetical protein
LTFSLFIENKQTLKGGKAEREKKENGRRSPKVIHE